MATATMNFSFETTGAIGFTCANGTLTYSTTYTETTKTISVSKLTLRTVKPLPEGLSAAQFDFVVTVGVGGSSYQLAHVTTSLMGPGETYTRSLNSSHTFSRAHTAQSAVLSVSSNDWDESGNTVSINIPARPSYTVSYNANGGSGAPSAQTKWYGESLALSSTRPTRPDYIFVRWNTQQGGGGTSYNPGASYTTNAALTLYAQWERTALPPTISGMSVVRCDSSGSPDDTGTYCNVTATWSVDRSSSGMSSNTGNVTGTIKAEDGSSRTITWQSGASGTGGTAVALVPNCDIDTQYTVTVTVTNTQKGTTGTTYLSTSRSDILTRAFFTMDFADGGRGVGILSAAPNEGLEVGLDAQFDEDVNVLGKITSVTHPLLETANINTVATYSHLYQFAQVAGSGGTVTLTMASNIMVIFARRGTAWGIWLITIWDSPLLVAGNGTGITVTFSSSTKTAIVENNNSGAIVVLALT